MNIALRLYQLAVEDKYDNPIIISGDTDLLPAVNTVQRLLPGKQIGVLIPHWKILCFKNQPDFHYRMNEKHLMFNFYLGQGMKSSAFDEEFKLA